LCSVAHYKSNWHFNCLHALNGDVHIMPKLGDAGGRVFGSQ